MIGRENGRRNGKWIRKRENKRDIRVAREINIQDAWFYALARVEIHEAQELIFR